MVSEVFDCQHSQFLLHLHRLLVKHEAEASVLRNLLVQFLRLLREQSWSDGVHEDVHVSQTPLDPSVKVEVWLVPSLEHPAQKSEAELGGLGAAHQEHSRDFFKESGDEISFFGAVAVGPNDLLQTRRKECQTRKEALQHNSEGHHQISLSEILSWVLRWANGWFGIGSSELLVKLSYKILANLLKE